MGIFSKLFLQTAFSDRNKRQERVTHSSGQGIDQMISQNVIENAQYFKTDVVEITWVSVCCEKCGKYRGRWFSLSGQSKKYPKLPADFHMDCGLLPNIVIDGINSPQYYTEKQLQRLGMNLPDTRTREEKDLYEKEQHGKRQERKDRADYEWLQGNLPDLAPKSYAGYRRMRGMNSANFKKIQEAAKQEGRHIG